MICYFSGTGNTRWVARQLAERTGDNLLFMPDVLGGNCRLTLKSNERLGFVFPVHGWRPPVLVRKFIEQLSLNTEAAPYCYAVCTAGDFIGKTMDILRNDLAAKGIQLNAAFSLIMPESYVGLPFMDVDPAEKELRKKARAAQDLQTIQEDIYNKRETEKLKKGPLGWFFSVPVGAFFAKKLITDKPFHVAGNSEKGCIKCGKCAKVCPVGNIEGEKGKQPVWNHNGQCLTCFACYHYCPQHVIMYGKRTRNKGQYYFEKQ